MTGRNKETLEERLLRNCEKTGGCWICTAGKDKDGYGRIRYRWREMGAHNAAFEVWRSIVPEGLWVLHRCDNPSCINPEHLFLGTALDNAQDRDKKGRGGHNPRSGENWIYLAQWHKRKSL
jgi:hypothetical protein